MDEPNTGKKRRKGIYLLPNLFTTGTLFGGFFAIISAMDGQFSAAAAGILAAMVADGLDGRRKKNEKRQNIEVDKVKKTKNKTSKKN